MTTLRGIAAGAFVVPAVLLIQGCTAGGTALPDDSPLYLGEMGCTDTSVDSPTDQACHEDCVRDCGFNGSPGPRDAEHPDGKYPRAKKYCVCQGGVFIECRCPRPDWYIGATTAPYCDPWSSDGSGWASTVASGPNGEDVPCDREWMECIGRDPVDGYTPRGAVCLDKRGNGVPIWIEGSTEKWFYPEQ